MGCRRVRSRDLLVRIASDGDGRVAWDRAGTAPGRGAYVCSTMECVDQALRRGRISRALRTEVGERALSDLKEEFLTRS